MEFVGEPQTQRAEVDGLVLMWSERSPQTIVEGYEGCASKISDFDIGSELDGSVRGERIRAGAEPCDADWATDGRHEGRSSGAAAARYCCADARGGGKSKSVGSNPERLPLPFGRHGKTNGWARRC